MALPPTSSKISSDANEVTTFKFDFPNFTGTHTGTLLSLGVNSIAGGGTGQTTANAAFAALSPLTTAGDIIYENNTPAPARLPIGSSSQYLSVVAGLPSWTSVAPSGSAITAKFGVDPTLSGNLTFAGGATIILPFTYYDTNSAYNAGTGQFTAPFTGYYDITTNSWFTDNVDTFVLVNGVTKAGRYLPNSPAITNGSVQLFLTLGDIVTFEFDTTSNLYYTALTNTPSGYIPTVSITLNANGTGGGGGGTVTAVTASSPLASSGGATPNISFTGILPIANGGTNASSASTAFNNLSPITTTGDLIYSVSGATNSRLPIGTSGQVLSVSSGIPSWQPVSATLNLSQAVISEQQASGTNGGTATAGSWFTRVLNTTEQSQSWLSLSTNQFTLQAGTYTIHAEAPCNQTDFFQTRLRNITDSTTTIIGTSEYNENAAGAAQTVSFVDGTFTISAAKTFELQMQVVTNNGSASALGRAGSFGTEVYSRVVLNKLTTTASSMRYYSSTTTISSSLATIVYATQDYDTDAAYSSGTYTVPQTGKYQVNASLLIAGTISLNNTLIMEIQKNGTVVSRRTVYLPASLTDGSVQVNDIINCATSDTLRIQVSTSAVLPTIVSSNFDNFLSIGKID